MIIKVCQILTSYAQEAWIPVPNHLEEYDVLKFPHWNLFCLMQLGKEFSDSVLTHNANVISRIDDAEVLNILPSQLIQRGFIQ